MATHHLEFLSHKKKKIKRMSSEGDEEKERLTSIVVGKSEGRGFNKEGGTARSVGSNFHFFHLFASLTVVLKKCYGGTRL